MLHNSSLRRATLRALLLIAVALVGTTIGAQSQLQSDAQSDTKLDIPSLITEVENKGKENTSRLLGYTFRLKHIEQELNDKDEVKKETSYLFQAFPLSKGNPVLMLLSENGKDLSPQRLAKEKAKANKEWRKRKLEIAGKPGEPEPLSFLRTSEFALLRSDRYKDRDVIVLRFKPRADFRPTKDAERLVSKLEGEMWIDPVEKIPLKLEARLVEKFSLGGLSGLFASLRPGWALVLESAPLSDKSLPNGLWAANRLEVYSLAKPLLSKTVRSRQKNEFSDYKPFDKDADKLPDNY